MKINLLRNYGGRNTNEQRILPGVYDASDERLFGLAEYLVENGHAVVVGESLSDLPDGAFVIHEETQSAGADETIVEPESAKIELDETNRAKVKRRK